MSAQVLVVILRVETKPSDKNIANLEWIFSDPYFIVQVITIDPPTTIPPLKYMKEWQYLENYYMRKALTFAAEGPYTNDNNNLIPQRLWTSLPVIIIKDSSISNLTPADPHEHIDGMVDRIKFTLQHVPSADLIFLCKWNDYCDKYVDVANNIGHGSNLQWSINPTATQAILYTPSTRDYIRKELANTQIYLADILNSKLAKEKLKAAVFVPNIVDYDISVATANSDFAKLNECALNTTASTTSTNVYAVIWAIVIVLIIFLVAWILVRMVPPPSYI